MAAWWILIGALVAAAEAGAYRFAVLPFDNAGGPEFEVLGVGLQSMITTDLAQADDVEVVERARLQDLLDEMELAGRGVVDPKTAAEVGKVLQASHVVVGSFTVVGDTMRLDARAAEVSTAKVAFQAERTGPRDAFFELEKDLVTQLIEGVGAELSAKARFSIGRHTADFGVFTEFSRGVQLFDEDRYAEASRVLEQVTQSDPTFVLAADVLDALGKVRQAAEAKAAAARVAKAEAAFVVHQTSARAQASLVDRLTAIAEDDGRDRRDRVTANQLLLTGLGGWRVSHGGFRQLREAADQFALLRQGELAYQGIWRLMRSRVPDWFPAYEKPNAFFSEDRDFDWVFPRERHALFDGSNPYRLLSTCKELAHRIDDDWLSMLWVPYERRLDLRRDVYRDSGDCMKGYGQHMLEVAEAYVDVGRPGRAAAILSELTARETDARLLDRVARVAADSEARTKLLDQFPEGSAAREALQFGRASVRELTERPEVALFRVHYAVRKEWPIRNPMFVSGLPTWVVGRKQVELVTGPRTGVDETNALRHYRDLRKLGGPYGQRQAEPPTFVVVGGVPRGDLQASVDLRFDPPDDWWPLQYAEKPAGWRAVDERPVSGIVVGVREIETDPLCDPVTDQLQRSIPTTGIGALVVGDELVLARVLETHPEPEQCNVSPTYLRAMAVGEILARKPMKKQRVRLEVAVRGSEVRASAGGAKVSATVSEGAGGFTALLADGQGFVEFSNLTWE